MSEANCCRVVKKRLSLLSCLAALNATMAPWCLLSANPGGGDKASGGEGGTCALAALVGLDVEEDDGDAVGLVLERCELNDLEIERCDWCCCCCLGAGMVGIGWVIGGGSDGGGG